MEKKVDLRVQKTRKALCEALWSLLNEKDFGKITITELCDRAMVRKATFYAHFSDKVELLAYLVEQMQEKARLDNAIGYDEKDPKSYYVGVFRFFMGFLEENEAFVRGVFRSNVSSTMLDVLIDEIELDIRLRLKQEEEPLIRDSSAMLAALFAGGVVNCGRWWITSPRRPSKDVVVGQFATALGQMRFGSNDAATMAASPEHD